MLINLHKQGTTTPKVRAVIQSSRAMADITKSSAQHGVVV
jgi:hypothetical protein